MGAFSAAVADGLRTPPRLGTRLVALEPGSEGAGFRLDLEVAQAPGADAAVDTLGAEQVVLATDAFCAAPLARPVAPEAAKGLAAIPYSPIVSIALGVERRHCGAPPRGFGFLVPRTEGRALLGCLYMARLFAERAPEGCDLLHCMLGGVRAPALVEEPEDVLLTHALEVLDPVLGLREAPEVLRVQRWARAVAQPVVGHEALVRRVRAALPPGLELAGAYLDGVAVGDAVASGVGAAERLLAQRKSV